VVAISCESRLSHLLAGSHRYWDRPAAQAYQVAKAGHSQWGLACGADADSKSSVRIKLYETAADGYGHSAGPAEMRGYATAQAVAVTG
jgi:hypothetical protein